MKALYDLEKREIFEKALPRTKEDERTFLSADLKEHGCMNPIITYHGAIIDGHTRYDICHELGIPFEVEEMEFEDDVAALLWVLRNQLGRRNLSTFEKCELVLPLEEQLRKEAKERQGERTDLRNIDSNLNQCNGSQRTIEQLANFAGTSVGNMFKSKWLHNNADPDTLDQLRQGKISIHKAYTNLKGTEPVNSMPGYGLVKAPEPTPEGVSFRAPDSVYDEPPIEVYGLAPAEDIERRSKTEMVHVSSDLKTNTDRFVYRVSQILGFLSPASINEDNITAIKEIITEGYNNIMELIDKKGGINHV